MFNIFELYEIQKTITVPIKKLSIFFFFFLKDNENDLFVKFVYDDIWDKVLCI